jgi:hypothetical protein
LRSGRTERSPSKEIVMKSSNLALRLEDDQPRPWHGVTWEHVPAVHEPSVHAPADRAVRRPRRSLEFRSIVIRDQGFAPFRVR